MEIYVVRAGDTLSRIASSFDVPLSQLIQDNGLTDPYRLVVGQALVVRFPTLTYTVQPGDTLFSIARRSGLSLRQLWRNNPILQGNINIYSDQTLVLAYRQQGQRPLTVNGYAYPFIDKALLRATLPYLTWLTPFTYGITPEGGLVDLDDRELIALSRAQGAAPMMHLSTLTEEGGFSNDLAHLVLTDSEIQAKLIDAVEEQLKLRGYEGLDVDFEFVFPQDAIPYADFLKRLHDRLSPQGYLVTAALAPKISADQPGLLYEGHNYSAVGAAVDRVLLMTYEWGYTYGPPMAVAPLPNVRRVVEYALTEIPAEKLWLGIPNYGYDWPLPFRQGTTKATSISTHDALQLALHYGAEIQFDSVAQSPWFRYQDEQGVEHEVWFEDARSISAKLSLISEYRLSGAGYWNMMRPFTQNWQVLTSLFQILPD